MVAEILTGIALIGSAVKGIKGAIGTAKDISTIAEDIDKLFAGASQVKKKKKPSPLLVKWDLALKSKLGDNADRFSIGNVARDHIERKMAEESMDQMRSLINRRFGLGAWEDIVLEHQELIDKAKSAAKKERERKEKKLEATLGIIKNVGFLIIGTIAIGGLIIWSRLK